MVGPRRRPPPPPLAQLRSGTSVSASAAPSLSLVGLAALLALSLALVVAPLSLPLPLTLTAQAQPVSSTRTVVTTDFTFLRDLALDANGNLYGSDFVSRGAETRRDSAVQRSAAMGQWQRSPCLSDSAHSHRPFGSESLRCALLSHR